MAERARNTKSSTPRLVALRYLLKPIVRFCIKGAHTLQEFIDILKVVFVEVSQDELNRNSIKVNANRISIMSGVHRRDVAEILVSGEAASEKRVSPISQIIGTWEQSSRFSSKGKARFLSIDKGENSFFALVHSVSKHLHPKSVLDELVRTGVVRRNENTVHLSIPVSRVGFDPTKRFRLLGRNMQSLFEAADQNFEGTITPPHHHIRTEYDSVPIEHLPKIREWLLEEGAMFHKKARDFLSQFDSDINPLEGEKEQAKGRVVLASFSLTSEEQEPNE